MSTILFLLTWFTITFQLRTLNNNLVTFFKEEDRREEAKNQVCNPVTRAKK